MRRAGIGARVHEPGIEPFAAASDRVVAPNSDLARIYYAGNGRLVHKWDHYFPIYERHLGKYRGQPVRMIELGVSHGGSLQMWRKYLGPQAVIYGVDIDPRCSAVDDADLKVRIGSQADRVLLKKIVDEMGGVDVVIDDGSHIASHMRASFETLFPLLDATGVYIAEDLHAAYWPGFFEGGYRRPGTFIEEMKRMVDHMHWWYHGRRVPEVFKSVTGVHFYDSVTVLEKGVKERPFHTQVGKPSF